MASKKAFHKEKLHFMRSLLSTSVLEKSSTKKIANELLASISNTFVYKVYLITRQQFKLLSDEVGSTMPIQRETLTPTLKRISMLELKPLNCMNTIELCENMICSSNLICSFYRSRFC